MVFNPFPNKPWFLRVCSISLLKTLREKEKLLVTSNFSFSHSVFYPFRKLSAIFIQFRNCCLQALSVWKGPKFVFWKRVNDVFNSISVISRRPVHLSMLSWSSFNQYSAQYSFQATGCLPTLPLSKKRTAVRRE